MSSRICCITFSDSSAWRSRFSRRAVSSSACSRTRFQATWLRSPSRMMIITAMPILAASASMPMNSESDISDIGQLQLAVETADDHDLREGAEHLLGLQARHLLAHLSPDHQSGGAAAGERAMHRTGTTEDLVHLGADRLDVPAALPRPRNPDLVEDLRLGVAEFDLAGHHLAMEGLPLGEFQLERRLLFVQLVVIEPDRAEAVTHGTGFHGNPVQLESAPGIVLDHAFQGIGAEGHGKEHQQRRQQRQNDVTHPHAHTALLAITVLPTVGESGA